MQPILAPPSPIEQQWAKDIEHIKLLAVFHFVVAALGFLGAGICVLESFVFRYIIAMAKEHPQPGGFQNGPPQAMIDLFTWFYLVIGAVIAVASLLNLLSGFFLLRKKYRAFSLFVGGLDCLQIPFGTVLGVFTLIVLLRDSVRTLYERQATPAAAMGDDRELEVGDARRSAAVGW